MNQFRNVNSRNTLAIFNIRAILDLWSAGNGGESNLRDGNFAFITYCRKYIRLRMQSSNIQVKIMKLSGRMNGRNYDFSAYSIFPNIGESRTKRRFKVREKIIKILRENIFIQRVVGIKE